MLRKAFQIPFVFILLLWAAVLASEVMGQPAETPVISLLEGRVTMVADGDDIEIRNGKGETFHVRLQGIDAPESKQPFGRESQEHLARLIDGKSVKILISKKDALNRYLGSVFRRGEDVNIKQIEAGLAWHYRVYSAEQSSEERKRYAAAEAAARENRIGLWKDPAPMPPWEFRGEVKPPAKAVPVASSTTSPPRSLAPKQAAGSVPAAANSKYQVGPRGGCYYISEGGRKVYVNKSFCGQ